MTPVVRHASLVLAAGVALALAACGKSSEPQAPAGAATAAAPATAASVPAASGSAPAAAGSAAPAGAATTAATAPAPISVAKLTLGNAVGDDYAVTKEKTTFSPNDHTIYAAVATEGQATGANLNARWTYEDGQTVNDLTQSITATGPATTTFKIHNPNAWPAGKYKVSISLDGNAVASQDFEIAKR